MPTDIVLKADEQSWEFEILAGSSVILGRRQEGVDICLPDMSVARRHARVFEERDQWYVEDLGSHCGVYVNGAITRGSHPIRAGDHIRIGGVELRVDSRQVG